MTFIFQSGLRTQNFQDLFVFAILSSTALPDLPKNHHLTQVAQPPPLPNRITSRRPGPALALPYHLLSGGSLILPNWVNPP